MHANVKRRRVLVSACLMAAACSSGGGGSPGTGGTGAGAGGTTGQAGASAGSSGGSATAGAAGTQAAGTGGGLAGTGGASAAGTGGSAGNAAGAAGTTGQAGATGGAGTTGGAGRGGTTGAAGTTGGAGRGGTSGGAGTGGGAGSGGSGGSSPDGGVTNPVTPTMSGTTYRFAWGDVVMEVDSAVGARVSKLSLGGTDLIMTSAMAGKLDAGGLDPTTWGSVFWTSPRSSWPGTMWPPPVNIDGAAYTTSIAGTHVVASGPADTTLGVSMAKDYSADAASGWIKIAYTIKATKGQRAAPWEVSRVPRGGIVFFPVPSASAVTKGPLTITTANNIVWFDDAPKTATSPTGEKLFADGTTWTAYLLGRNLFLKRFTDTPASMQPTNEGEIDVYPGNGFLEFEVQGPYTQIAANGSLPWSIEWKVVTVPTSIAVTSGSTALVDFAKQQVAQ